MDILKFCVKNRVKINVITYLLVNIIMGISILIFKNDNWSYWHWVVICIGGAIMWFVTFCIIDEKVLTKTKYHGT